MLANLKMICQFHAHSVHQNSVFSADLTMYWFPVTEFKPLVIWIWNQNIAISTVVGTSSHIKDFNAETNTSLKLKRERR